MVSDKGRLGAWTVALIACLSGVFILGLAKMWRLAAGAFLLVLVAAFVLHWWRKRRKADPYMEQTTAVRVSSHCI